MHFYDALPLLSSAIIESICFRSLHSAQIKALRLIPWRYSRCVSILDGKRQQCSLLLSLFAHESVVGAYVIQQMADRLFSVGNRCSALLAFTQMLQVFLMGNSCVYAIDMVKLRCGWFNPSDIYKIGGSVMFRFMQKQSGLSHFGFWPSPHLWTGQLKIYHVGA